MSEKKVFGKYTRVRVIQTLARKDWSKAEVKKVFAYLGCDVAHNTINTQFTECKNAKYAKEDAPFTDEEWQRLEQARNGEAGANQGHVTDDELLQVKKVASDLGGVARLKKVYDTFIKLQL